MRGRELISGAILLLSMTTTAFAGSDFESSKLAPGIVVQGSALQSSKLSSGIVVQHSGFQSSKISVGIVLLAVPGGGGVISRAPLTHW
jgi:hypothetical protein